MFSLTACTQIPVKSEIEEKNNVPPELLEAVKNAKESEKIVELSLKETKNSDQELELEIILKNPKNAKINSLRSFLAFNPETIEGAEININEELEEKILIAPNENNFDNQNGVMKLGFSFKEEILNTKEIKIASIKFNKLKQDIIMIDFYNAQKGGHTEVLGIFNGHVKNLLKKPASPALILQNENE